MMYDLCDFNGRHYVIYICKSIAGLELCVPCIILTFKILLLILLEISFHCTKEDKLYCLTHHCSPFTFDQKQGFLEEMSAGFFKSYVKNLVYAMLGECFGTISWLMFIRLAL